MIFISINSNIFLLVYRFDQENIYILWFRLYQFFYLMGFSLKLIRSSVLLQIFLTLRYIKQCFFCITLINDMVLFLDNVDRLYLFDQIKNSKVIFEVIFSIFQDVTNESCHTFSCHFLLLYTVTGMFCSYVCLRQLLYISNRKKYDVSYT